MPKVHNTIKERKAQLYERITPEYLFNNTSIFKSSPGLKALDPETVERIKADYKLYFESWIKDEAYKFLL